MRKNTLWLFLLISVLGLWACSGSSDNGSDDTDPVTLNVSPTSISATSEASDQEVGVTSNADWSVTSSADWLQVSAQSGSGNGAITLSVEANQSTEARTAVVQVAAGELVREISLEQAGADDSGTTPDEYYDIPPDSSDIRDLTSVEMAQLLGIGWNLGNSLEAIGGETEWGNPLVNQQLIDAVKAAGFDSVRLPVAWSQFSDEENFIIDTAWMDRVEEVVNYILDADMYVVMNIHWDGGWKQPTYEQEDYVNLRLATMWQQIATRFRDYDDRLLFAGTNEVMVEGDYGTPTEEYYTVQNGFNRTFVETVRATGGRNFYRHLVVQGFNTNIDHTVNFAVMPEDVLEDRLMMEVHYYDPYDFTLNENSDISQWGSIATDPEVTQDWANESYVDEQFQRMKTHFIDQGIGVILGEYGVISRPYVDGHEVYRDYWNQYITQSAVNHGLVPMYWDNGYTGEHGLGLFDRETGEQVYPELIHTITRAGQ